METYLQAIQRKVCTICIDGVFDEDDRFERCGLSQDRVCPIVRHLPKIVQLVRDTDSQQMEDYVDRLRLNVCSECEETPEGICDFRLKADCALDMYFTQVIEAIEEVDEGKFRLQQKSLSNSLRS